MTGTTIGFTGQRFDSETGLYYYKYRLYDPATGRFIQPDPIGYGPTLNLYNYVNNDPLQFVDPLGLVAGPKGGGEQNGRFTKGNGWDGTPPLGPETPPKPGNTEGGPVIPPTPVPPPEPGGNGWDGDPWLEPK